MSKRAARTCLLASAALLMWSASASLAADALSDGVPTDRFGVGVAELPHPLSLAAVTQIARAQRAEVAAARARASAARERPAQVSALEDPMLQWSADHYPFDRMRDRVDEMSEPLDGTREPTMGRRYDRSITVEQRFPLSGIRGHRRRSAQADAERLAAEADNAALDVALDAATAFLMLHEQREMLRVADEQRILARQLVAAAGARYGAGQAGQADVLRAEVELARIDARLRALEAESRAAEAMLNTSLGRPTQAPVPPLHAPAVDAAPPPLAPARAAALRSRPELRAGAAEIRRADAEVEIMRSMYRPMAMVRAGTATTMAEGDGAMLMVGVSVPLWRGALRAGVAEAGFMQNMARAELEAMQRMVEGEVAAAREQVQASLIQFVALRDDVVPRAEMALQPALAAYRAGQENIVSVIEATRALWAVEAELVMAEVELGLAWARLERVVGSRLESLQ